jgi:hypothetical protein
MTKTAPFTVALAVAIQSMAMADDPTVCATAGASRACWKRPASDWSWSPDQFAGSYLCRKLGLPDGIRVTYVGPQTPTRWAADLRYRIGNARHPTVSNISAVSSEVPDPGSLRYAFELHWDDGMQKKEVGYISAAGWSIAAQFGMADEPSDFGAFVRSYRESAK